MAEGETRSGIDVYKKLEHGADSPATLIQQTYVVMSLPRNAEVNPALIGIANAFLTDSTLELVDSMEQGLYSATVNRHLFTTEDRRKAHELLKVDPQDPFVNEAYDIAQTVFGSMPRRLHLPYGNYRIPFAYRGMLRPPITLRQAIDKIGIIRRGVVDFATGRESDDQRFARAFFKVGATDPLKIPESEREAVERFSWEMGRLFDIPSNDPRVVFDGDSQS